jgi:hypothetical protein
LWGRASGFVVFKNGALWAGMGKGESGEFN